jgi:hypothetical protein
MMVITKATLPKRFWKQLAKVFCPIRVPIRANKPAMIIELITIKTIGSTIINNAFPKYIIGFIV